MKHLKILFGTFLVLSLTMPLSTCTGIVEEGSNQPPKRIERYVISKDSIAGGLLWAFTFIFPFGAALATRKKPASIKFEVCCLISVIPAGFVIWAHSETGKLVFGGFIALASILGFAGVSLLSLTKVSMEKLRSRYRSG